MASTTIRHPETGRDVAVRVWDIETRAIAAAVKAGRTAKDISWDLLSQKDSIRAMRATEGGDSARNNFALSVLEHALDWSLGLAVIRFIRDACAARRCPKTFQVGASRRGDVFIIVRGTHVFKY